MKIEYRKCRNDDLEFLLKLKELTLKWYVEKIYGWDETIQREKTLQELSSHKEDMRIVLCGQKEIGVTTFYEKDGDYVIGLIMIHPEYQGLGIGTEIISEYKSIAQKEQKRLLIKTYKHNPARKLYEKSGFKVYNEDNTHVYLCIE